MSAQTSTMTRASRRPDRRTFAVLMGAAVVCSLVLLPYSLTLQDQAPGPQQGSVLATMVAAVVQGIVLTGIAAGLGLWLGPKVDLGAPDLRAWLAGEAGAGRRVRAALPLATALGLVLGAAIVAVGLVGAAIMPQSVQEGAHPPVWQGFLAAIGAGVTEEVWLRLGLVTVLVYAGARLSRRQGQPPAGIVWGAIVLASLAFAAMHLPLAASLGALTTAAVAYVLALNGLAGMVLGWLYWRRGLLAAVAAHFTADIVLHVVAPATGLLGALS